MGPSKRWDQNAFSALFSSHNYPHLYTKPLERTYAESKEMPGQNAVEIIIHVAKVFY